jgi:hypothetical protein
METLDKRSTFLKTHSGITFVLGNLVCWSTFLRNIFNWSKSQWPRCLGRESAAVRFLELGTWIPPEHESLSLVSVVCRQVENSASDYLSSRGVLPNVSCLTECHLEISTLRRPRPPRTVQPWNQFNLTLSRTITLIKDKYLPS